MPPLDDARIVCGASISGVSPKNHRHGRFNCELQAHDVLTPHQNGNYGKWPWYEGTRASDSHEISNALAEIDRYPKSGASLQAKRKIVEKIRSLLSDVEALTAELAEVRRDSERMSELERLYKAGCLNISNEFAPTVHTRNENGEKSSFYEYTIRALADKSLSVSASRTPEQGETP